MSEFRRFSDGEADDPARALFRSMRDDAPSPGRKGDVLAAALAAAATVTVATTASAAIGSAGAASAASAQVPAAAAVVSGAAPAAALPIAAAASAPLAASIVPGVSIVKMIGAFVLGGAVTATGLVAGTQLLDPPSASPRPSVSATMPVATTATAPVVAKALAPREAAEKAEEVAPPTIESARVAASAAPVVSPSARADRGEKTIAPDLIPPVPVASVVVPPEPSLADEVSSLDAARRALSSGDGPGALRALDVFQGKFPRARLGTEALVLRVEALVASGRAGEARGLGDSFLSAHPDSPFAPRVRRAIGQKENVLTIP